MKPYPPRRRDRSMCCCLSGLHLLVRRHVPRTPSKQLSMRSPQPPAVSCDAGSNSSSTVSRSSRCRSRTATCSISSAMQLEAGVRQPPATVLSLPLRAPRQEWQGSRATGEGRHRSKTAPEPCHVPVPQFVWPPDETTTQKDVHKANEDREEVVEGEHHIRSASSRPMRLVRAPSKGRRQSKGSQPEEPPAPGVQQLPAHPKRKGGATGHRWVPSVAYPPADGAMLCHSRGSPRSTSSEQSEPPDYVNVMLIGGFVKQGSPESDRTASTSVGGASTQATSSAVLSEDELSHLPSPRSGVGSAFEQGEEARDVLQDSPKWSPQHNETGLISVRLDEEEVTPAVEPCSCVCAV